MISLGLANGLAPRITLNDGTIEGHYLKTIRGREFEAFEGVPYAKPPVGELRFEVTISKLIRHFIVVINLNYSASSTKRTMG